MLKNQTVGANPALLPNRAAADYNIKTAQRYLCMPEGQLTIKQLLETASSNSTICIPRGVYLTDSICLKNKCNLHIDAFEVVLVFSDYTKTAITLENCKDIAVHGLTIDHVEPANTQGDVLSTEPKSLVWQAHKGFVQNLCSEEKFFVPNGISPPGEGFRKGQLRPFTDLGFSRVEPTGQVGTFKLYGENCDRMCVGDTVVFRGKAAYVNHFIGCENITYENVTILNGSGFAIMERDGVGNTLLNRVMITPGPKPQTAERERLVSTCDATHSANMRKGICVKNSVFEKMTDDAANIHSYFGRVQHYNHIQKTLFYTTGTKNYGTINAPFQTGDELLLFSQEEQLYLKTKTLSPTSVAGKNLYSVTVELPENMKLTGNEILQNMSATGNGFLYENCVVENNRSRGFLIKASHGCIRNCTFKDNGMSAILIKPEIPDGWGECGYVNGLTIENNILENSGFFTGSDLHSAINIEADSLHPLLMHKNILIRGNFFGRRYTRFAVCACDVNGISICGNTFEGRVRAYNELFDGEYNKLYPDDDAPVIYLRNVRVDALENNVYPKSVKNPIVLSGDIAT
ncbi:MAG: hypothetical protein RR415_07320 [Ruthenibacterium sp.]